MNDMITSFNTEQFQKDISEHRSTMMGLSIIAIILFHQHVMDDFPLTVFRYYGYWGVDLFLLLSGMGLVNALQKYHLRMYYQRRLQRLLPSCLFCGILKCIIVLSLSAIVLIPSGFPHINWLSPLSLDLWYIRAILVYYLLSPFLHKQLQVSPWLTIGIITILFFINGLFFRIHDSESPTWIIERLLVFTIGMLLMLRRDILSSKTMLLSALFLIIAIAIAAKYKGDIYANPLFWTMMIFCLALGTITIIYLTTLLLKQIPQPVLIPFKWIGTISLELYLIHEFVFGAVTTLTSQFFGNATQFITSLALSIILAYLCKQATKRIGSL